MCVISLRPWGDSGRPSCDIVPSRAEEDVWAALPEPTARQLRARLDDAGVRGPVWKRLQISVRCARERAWPSSGDAVGLTERFPTQ